MIFRHSLAECARTINEVQTRRSLEAQVNWKAIARDTLIVWCFTALGGLIVGFAFGLLGAAESPKALLAIGFSNLVFGAVGFIIVSAFARTESPSPSSDRRRRHSGYKPSHRGCAGSRSKGRCSSKRPCWRLQMRLGD
jgi:hypothetical protein